MDFLTLSMAKKYTDDSIQGVSGQPGKDGVSPIVSVSAITGGHRVSITDVNGTTTFDVMNGSGGSGEGGAGGNGIASVTMNSDYTLTLYFTDGTSYTTPSIRGADGYTPVRGTDYWTTADKFEIVNATLAALPTWTGGSY